MTDQSILITGISSIHGFPIWQYFCACFGRSVHGICPVKMARYFHGEPQVYPCDIEDANALSEIFARVDPDAVIHAGGVCDLDMCEDMPEFAYKVNVTGAENIAQCAHDRYVLYISSDLVFSGDDPPLAGYAEHCKPDPVSVVGATYCTAEQKIARLKHYAIMRIGLPLGPSLTGTKGAIDFIAKRFGAGKKMTLFYDEVRSVITTDDLARGVGLLFAGRHEGLWHYAGPHEMSLYQIGQHVVDSGDYRRDYLIGCSRFEEKNGPPRIGRVALDSSRFYEISDFVPVGAFPERDISAA